jgi:hypothetical protein
VDQGHDATEDVIETNDPPDPEDDVLEHHMEIMDQANDPELNLELEIMEGLEKVEETEEANENTVQEGAEEEEDAISISSRMDKAYGPRTGRYC